MLQFRAREVGLAFDLSKAYNTLRTGLTERHLRQFLWRFDHEGPWLDLALDRVHFGDRSAASQLEVGKDMVADKGEEIDPEAASRIKKDTYVDDGLTGGSPEQVRRFVGELGEDGKFTGTIQRIFSIGNFKI